jgi:hypothetical protein
VLALLLIILAVFLRDRFFSDWIDKVNLKYQSIEIRFLFLYFFTHPKDFSECPYITTRSFVGLLRVVVNDFNHDGKLDIAAVMIANSTPMRAIPYVPMFSGQGDGTFAAPIISNNSGFYSEVYKRGQRRREW